jgi:pyruvate dehydrogenase E1 component alpha subunit
VQQFGAQLQAQGLLTEPERLQLDARALAEVSAAVAFAEAAPWEPAHDLLLDVYSPAPLPDAIP